ncbi:LuxR C-terminal-related transcriptional regulator [Sorangium sp. So ce315]|uniref:response regulator transcription factor n=1 Tax=Sorangium sp. So ce315 TaxID=3133299 RepID=UPI003F6234D4
MRGHRGTPALSEREAEVIRMVAEGHAIKEIAARLDLSARTVETYEVRAMDKLGLKSRADTVRHALQQGWLRRGQRYPSPWVSCVSSRIVPSEIVIT